MARTTTTPRPFFAAWTRLRPVLISPLFGRALGRGPPQALSRKAAESATPTYSRRSQNVGNGPSVVEGPGKGPSPFSEGPREGALRKRSAARPSRALPPRTPSIPQCRKTSAVGLADHGIIGKWPYRPPPPAQKTHSRKNVRACIPLGVTCFHCQENGREGGREERKEENNHRGRGNGRTHQGYT